MCTGSGSLLSEANHRRLGIQDTAPKPGSITLVVTSLAVLLLSLIAPGARAQEGELWQWTQAGSAGTDNIISLVCGGTAGYGGTQIYAGSDNGTVYEEPIDEGDWTQVGSNTLGSPVCSLASGHFKLYAAPMQGPVCENDLEGGAWTQVGSNYPWSSYYTRCMICYDGKNVYVGCENGGIYKYTEDSGAWIQIGDAMGDEVYSLASDGSKLYAGCKNGKVYENTLSGGAWSQTGSNAPGSNVQSLVYYGSKLYAGCESGVVYENTLGGGEWSQTSSNTPGSNVHSLISHGSKLYAGCDNGKVYEYSPDGGKWSQTGLNSPGTHVYALDFYSLIGPYSSYDRLYAGCSGGTIKKLSRGCTVDAAVSNGHGTVDPESQTVIEGGSATVNLHPSAGFQVESVTDNGEVITPVPASTYSIDDIDTDHYLEVAFSPLPSSTWYLAEGSTAWGFSDYISIENPNGESVTATVTYMPEDGANVTRNVILPANSQTTINPADTIGETDFSARVSCVDPSCAIAVDRTMIWKGEGAASEEGHSSIGVTAPATTWYLPEGSSNWGFECWLLVQNPGDSDAIVNFKYMIEGGTPKTVTHEVKAHSRETFNMEADIGQHDASVMISSDEPVIPERAMYRNNRREGHCSIGTTFPAPDYYLAEGTSAWGFTTYVLIQNPNNSENTVTLTYLTPSGPVTSVDSYTMQPDSRMTVRVNDVLPDTDFSTHVHGELPLIAERSMFWGAGTPLGEACHDSIGTDSTYTTFYLPDGQTSLGRETWTLVSNTNDSDVLVGISYLTEGGTANQAFITTIPANSRQTFNMADRGISGRAAVLVTCMTSGKKIICERAMYWNSRGAGTDTIGGY